MFIVNGNLCLDTLIVQQNILGQTAASKHKNIPTYQRLSKSLECRKTSTQSGSSSSQKIALNIRCPESKDTSHVGR
jgi:hypothetical protein